MSSDPCRRCGRKSFRNRKRAGGDAFRIRGKTGDLCRRSGSLEDIRLLEKAGKGRLDVTVGSALDLFGGVIPFDLLKRIGNRE